MTMDGMLENAFEKFWNTRSGIANFRVFRNPSGDKAASRFLLAQEKAYNALKAENEEIFEHIVLKVSGLE